MCPKIITGIFFFQKWSNELISLLDDSGFLKWWSHGTPYVIKNDSAVMYLLTKKIHDVLLRGKKLVIKESNPVFSFQKRCIHTCIYT